MSSLVSLFLGAIGDRSLPVARRILAQHPSLSAESIHVAAAAADDAAVSRLLAEMPALATAASDGTDWPPLAYACWSTFHSIDAAHAAASQRVVTLLLDAGADVNSSTRTGDDPHAVLSVLYFACESNNVGVARLLLERGANPNDGESVYHAAEGGHIECLELLLAHHAETSAPHPHWKNTPLHFITSQAHDHDTHAPWVTGMRWLLEHGADPNVTSGDGRTPYAVAMRHGNDVAMALLNAHGASTESATPMDALLGALIRAKDTEARRLAAAMPDWTSRLSADERGGMVHAVHANRADAVRLMHELGFDLTWEGEWGGTPLHHAAWLGKPDIVRLLISLGAPVNVRDSTFSSSPIAWAAHGSTNHRNAEDDYAAVAMALLDAGAEWAPAINKNREPPTDFASPAVARVFESRGFQEPST